MSGADKPPIGMVAWRDLTVDDASGVSAFYAAVVGWKADAVEMGGYSDFNMCMPDSGEPAVGVCHSRDSNQGIPAQWLMYVIVEDLASSLEACRSGGGQVVREPAALMGGSFAIIQDPAGAVLALYQVPEDDDEDE